MAFESGARQLISCGEAGDACAQDQDCLALPGALGNLNGTVCGVGRRDKPHGGHGAIDCSGSSGAAHLFQEPAPRPGCDPWAHLHLSISQNTFQTLQGPFYFFTYFFKVLEPTSAPNRLPLESAATPSAALVGWWSGSGSGSGMKAVTKPSLQLPKRMPLFQPG